MFGGNIVAVFCDVQHEQELSALIKKIAQFSYKIIPVRNGPLMYREVRSFYASRDMYRCALNLCTGTTEDENGACPTIMASLFEDFGVVYGGCRYTLLKQPLDILFMVCFYAGLPLPRFSIIKSNIDIDQLDLKFPVKIRSANRFQGVYESIVQDISTLQELLKESIINYDKIVVWEVNFTKETELQVLVSGSGCVAISYKGNQDNKWVQHWTPKIEEYASLFAKGVMNKSGFAKLIFNISPHKDELILEDFELGCSLIDLNSELLSAVTVKNLLEECIREGERNYKLPVIEIQLGKENKGYLLCATKDIKKGELVFEDEGRSFAVVTKPFVEKEWGPEDKILFSEYAWPLDSDGHVYAIWESDPKRWRPINHSCNPNCIFDKDHSLNVIASRDINKGEEVTMDYSTFCDYTMKPFPCFCGSECCRGLIVPDEASLSKYGTNTWHRRPPLPHVKEKIHE